MNVNANLKCQVFCKFKMSVIYGYKLIFLFKVVSGLSPDTIRASVTRVPPEAEEKLLTQQLNRKKLAFPSQAEDYGYPPFPFYAVSDRGSDISWEWKRIRPARAGRYGDS